MILQILYANIINESLNNHQSFDDFAKILYWIKIDNADLKWFLLYSDTKFDKLSWCGGKTMDENFCWNLWKKIAKSFSFTPFHKENLNWFLKETIEFEIYDVTFEQCSVWEFKKVNRKQFSTLRFGILWHIDLYFA